MLRAFLLVHIREYGHVLRSELGWFFCACSLESAMQCVFVRNVAVQIISVHFDEREVKLFLLVVFLVVFLRVVFVMLVVFLLVVCVVLVVSRIRQIPVMNALWIHLCGSLGWEEKEA